MQPIRSLIETLKGRLRNNQDQEMAEYQDVVERRLQRPVDAGDQKPARFGGN